MSKLRESWGEIGSSFHLVDLHSESIICLDQLTQIESLHQSMTTNTTLQTTYLKSTDESCDSSALRVRNRQVWLFCSASLKRKRSLFAFLLISFYYLIQKVFLPWTLKAYTTWMQCFLSRDITSGRRVWHWVYPTCEPGLIIVIINMLVQQQKYCFSLISSDSSKKHGFIQILYQCYQSFTKLLTLKNHVSASLNFSLPDTLVLWWSRSKSSLEING